MLRDAFAKHPTVLTTLLFLVAIFAAVAPMLAFQSFLPQEAASSLARFGIGLVLIALFHDRFKWGASLSALPLAIPVLGFVAWNLIYNGLGGGQLVTVAGLISAVVVALGPALLEEVVFRGIGIQALHDHGLDTKQTLILSAVPFALIHLTNALGNPLADTLVQTCYAFVIGLVFGAIYLASNDIATVIVAHFAVDCSSHLFLNGPTTTSIPVLVAFAALLAAETAYALWVVKKTDERAV